MANLRVIRTLPGAVTACQLITDFAKKGGVITFRDDESQLWAHRFCLDHESVELMAFGQLVGRMLEQCQLTAPPLCSGPLATAAIEAACEAQPESSPYFASRLFPGLHRRMRDTLEDLERAGLQADHLRTASSETDGLLQEKLVALAALVEDRNLTFSKVSRTTNSRRMSQCLGVKPSSEVVLPRILLFAGDHCEPLFLEWIQWLVAIGVDLCIAVDTCLSEAKLFPEGNRLIAALETEAEVVGSPNRLTGSLFASAKEGEGLEVEIVSASDPLSECEWALRSCAKGIDAGVPRDEFVLYVRNLSSYVALLESAAKRFQIPLSVARRGPVLENRLAQMLVAVLDFCAGSDIRRLRPILASSYLGLSIEQRCEITQGIREAHRQHLPWEALSEFARGHAEDYPWLVETLSWREEALENPHPLREWCRLFAQLADGLVEGRFDDGAPTGARDRHAQDALQRALEQRGQIESARRSRPWNLENFAKAASRFWDTEEYWIPAPEGGVRVVSSAHAIGRARTVYVLGMLEGVFPRRRTEDPILTDEERTALAHLLNTRLPTSHERAAEERDEFYRICAAPTEQLILSYPQTGEDRDNVPAFYLQEIDRALGKVVRTDLSQFGPPLLDVTLPADRALLLPLSVPPQPAQGFELVTEEARALVAANPGDSFSPRDLRKAKECPFQFVFDTKVGVRSRRMANRWNQLRRLPMQAELFAAPDPKSAAESLIVALQEFLDVAAGEAPDHELSLLRVGGQRLMKEWIEREFAARELWPRTDVVSQVHFGDAGLRRELEFKVGKVRLKGTMPAISKSGGYKVVHLTDASIIKRGRDSDELSESDHLEIGAYLLSMYDGENNLALEIDSTAGRRTRLLLPRTESVRADMGNQLYVSDLGDQRSFFKTARELVLDVMQRIESGAIRPTPGEQCSVCDFGELCRSSRDFGDDADPF